MREYSSMEKQLFSAVAMHALAATGKSSLTPLSYRTETLPTRDK